MLGYEHGFIPPGRSTSSRRSPPAPQPDAVVRRRAAGAAGARRRRAQLRRRTAPGPTGLAPARYAKRSTPWHDRSPCSPASGPTCRSRRSPGSPPSGATTASRSPAGATTSTRGAGTTTSTSQGKLELLEKYGLKVCAISNHLKGQAVCDDPIDQRHRDILPDRVWGDGDPEGVRQRAAEEMKHTARLAAKLGVEDRRRLHRLVDLEVRRDVPAGLAGD